MRGWLKSYREEMEHPVWSLVPSQYKVWRACLNLANVKPGEWFDGRKRVRIPAGSFITSQEHLAQAAGVGRQVVRGALASLQRIGSISTQVATKRHTHVTVVNWRFYQGTDDQANPDVNQPATKDQPSGNHNGRRREGERLVEEPARNSAPAGVVAAPHQSRRKRESTDSNIKLVIDAYHQNFLERHGSPPPISGGKCGQVAKTMLHGRPVEEALWVVREFFKTPPEFYRDKGLYGLEHVLMAMPTLLARKGELERGL